VVVPRARHELGPGAVVSTSYCRRGRCWAPSTVRRLPTARLHADAGKKEAGSDADTLSPVRRPGCAQETVVACARTVVAGRLKREVETFATTVRGLLRLADCSGRTAAPRRDGSQRRLLAAGLAGARGALRAGPCQSDRCAQRARAQERCERRRVVGRSARARPRAVELRAAAPDPRSVPVLPRAPAPPRKSAAARGSAGR
jgi:hypothetical protein